jgi:hypothetical protein
MNANVNRGSSVGIATGYGLDDWGLNWGPGSVKNSDFSISSGGPLNFLSNEQRGSFFGTKAAAPHTPS